MTGRNANTDAEHPLTWIEADVLELDMVLASAPRPSQYLILGISLCSYSPYQRDCSPPDTICTSGFNNALFVTMQMPDREQANLQSGHWRICVETERKSIVTARHITSGLESLLTLLNHGATEDLSVQLIPPRVLRGRVILKNELLRSVEETAGRSGDFYLARAFRGMLGTFAMLPEILYADAFLQLPTLLQSRHLFEAATFFHSACKDFTFTGDTIGEILRTPSRTLDSERERIKLENVVLSSFRVVRSIAGRARKRTSIQTTLG